VIRSLVALAVVRNRRDVVYNQEALFERKATELRCMLHAYRQIGMFSDKELFGIEIDVRVVAKVRDDREARRR